MNRDALPRLEFRYAEFDSLRAAYLDERSVSSVQLFSVTSVISTLVTAALWMLWAWFGGRQVPLQPALTQAPTQETGSIEGQHVPTHIAWKALRTNPAVRFVGWLLLVILGLAIFRMGEAFVTALRSR